MTANLQARRDGEVKEETAKVLATTGLTVFGWIPNETTIAAIKDARAGKIVSFNNIENLMADLHPDG